MSSTPPELTAPTPLSLHSTETPEPDPMETAERHYRFGIRTFVVVVGLMMVLSLIRWAIKA